MDYRWIMYRKSNRNNRTRHLFPIACIAYILVCLPLILGNYTNSPPMIENGGQLSPTPTTTVSVSSPAPSPDITNTTFEQIYQQKIWTPEGGGSGVGSSRVNGLGASYILRLIMMKYRLTKLLDAPCGAAMSSWMYTTIQPLKSDIPSFQYYGVDVVGSVIHANRAKVIQEKMEKFVQYYRVDLSASSTTTKASLPRLPLHYDIILSRDALQHLPYQLIARVLHSYCETNSRYLLIGSYLHSIKSGDNRNRDIKVGETFHINVLQAPFLFPKPLEVFDEPVICAEGVDSQKSLLLYKLNTLCRSSSLLQFVQSNATVSEDTMGRMK